MTNTSPSPGDCAPGSIGVVLVEKSAGVISVRYAERATPSPGAGELLVLPAYVGICGSDLEQLHDEMPENFPIGFPHTLGHEWSGTVQEVGPDVTGFAVGDRIIGHGDMGGNRWFGVTEDGAMGDVFTVPAAMCMPVPDSVSLQNAALIEPFACVLNTMQKVGGVHAGQTVHIFGLGAIGLTAVMQAATSGATVVVFDPSPLRREKALAIGASCAVDPLLGVEANLDEIQASTGRRFADLVIEASGVAAAQAASLESADHGGRVVLMGISRPRPSAARLGLVQDRDLTVTTSVGAPAAVWPVALRFVENTGLDLTPIVSSVLPFSACVEAIQRAEEPGRDIKILLRPDTAFNTTQPALTGVG